MAAGGQPSGQPSGQPGWTGGSARRPARFGGWPSPISGMAGHSAGHVAGPRAGRRAGPRAEGWLARGLARGLRTGPRAGPRAEGWPGGWPTVLAASRVGGGPATLGWPPWPGWLSPFGRVAQPDFGPAQPRGQPVWRGGPARLGGWASPIWRAGQPDWGGGPARFGGVAGRVAGGPATHQIGLRPPLTGQRFLSGEYLVNIGLGRGTAQKRVTGGRWRRIEQGVARYPP